MKAQFKKATPSLFHQKLFAGKQVIRINLRAVKELLHDEKVTSFDLTQSQMRKLKNRFERYTSAGGRVDVRNGSDLRPEQRNGLDVRPAIPAIEPSIDHLPDKNILLSIR